MKRLLQILPLAIFAAFMYSRMAPVIRQSRAIQAHNARVASQPARTGQTRPNGSAPPPGQITSFVSDVTLRKDATVEVREEFVVRNDGDAFPYGLIRDLPIDSEARWDTRLVGAYQKDTGIRVKILEVSEDGAPASYVQGSDFGYPQLRIGEQWTPLPPGDHRFVVRYEADGVTQFLADHDQLYWNAIGHYWRLPVTSAIVRIHLPQEVPVGVVTADVFVGARGARAKPLEGRLERKGLPDGFEFRVANLGVTQSPSVWLTWPRGFLMPPALGPLAHDAGLLIAPLVLLLYYAIVWLALGREPQRGAVAIRYQPPQGLSPAALRYIRTTGCDGRTVAATIAQLAARGSIVIEPPQSGGSGKYKLTRIADVDPKTLKPPLAPEELSLYDALFEDGPSVLLDPRNGGLLNRYLNRIYQELHKSSGNLYFTRNAGWLVLGWFASFLMAVGMALVSHGRGGDRFTLLFLTWWFFFCFSLLGLISTMTLAPAFSRMLRGLGGAKEVLIGAAVVVAFGGGGIAVLWQLKSGASLAYALSLVALVGINIAAFPALRRLTPRGREMRDEIEGFRLFLEKVEQDRMSRVDAQDPHAVEAAESLPYAIALEVREAWGDHLAEACVAVTTTQ